MGTNIESIAHHHRWLTDQANGPRGTGHGPACRLFRNWLPGPDFTGGDEGRSVGAAHSDGRRGGTHN